MRLNVGFRGGGEPTDWQPQTVDEYIEASRTAWTLLLEVRDKAGASARLLFTKQLADALRTAYGSALREDIDRDLRDREWSPDERASLTAGLRSVLRYEELDESLREEVESLHDYLMGESLTERLPAILGTSVWDLSSDRRAVDEAPWLLVEAADELAEQGAHGIQLALSTGRDLDQQDTRYRLFRLLAERLGAEQVGEAALAESDWAAVSAALSVADVRQEGSWATSVLTRLASTEPDRVPELLSYVVATPSRVELVLELVEAGRASGSGLGRLLYGARIRELDEEKTLRVLTAVRISGDREGALGMLDQWLDEHEEVSPKVSELASEIALEALSSPPGSMTDYYVERLIEHGVIEPASLGDLWEVRMANRGGLVEKLDHVLTDKLLEDPTTATQRILGFIQRRDTAAAFGILASKDLALLSRLARVTSAGAVWAHLAAWPDDDLGVALEHMDWRGMEPEPLVRAFLLSDRLPELGNEAWRCFFNTLGVVTGPFYLALENELMRAQSWHASLAGTNGESWAQVLIERYENDVEWHRQRDQEENLRLR